MGERLSREMIAHVAKAARLNLTEEEVSMFQKELSDVLGWFLAIGEADVGGVKPSFHPIVLKDALREDKPKSCIDKDEAQSLSAHKKDGYYKGPRAV